MFLSFDVLTALTVSGILGILTLYIVVVYRKGWLKRDLRASESYFLCPNSKCRRVFRDPIWLTDLSKKPPQPYQACPHCSTDLQIPPSFNSVENGPDLERLSEDSKKSNQKVYAAPKENIPKRRGVLRSLLKNAATADVSKHSKAAPLDESKPQAQAPSRGTQAPKKHLGINASERPRACSHHFGYVKTLPKNTSIPDECLWCPWIVDCLAGTPKAEAKQTA